MKFKKFKKTLAIALACIFAVSSITIPVGANPTTVSLNWVIPGNSTYYDTTDLHLYAGDTMKFNFNSLLVYNAVFGLYGADGTDSIVHTTGHGINSVTITVKKTGLYRIRVANNSSVDLNVNSRTYTDNRVYKDAIIYTDWSGVISDADSCFRYSSIIFNTHFGISFNLLSATHNGLSGACPNTTVLQNCKPTTIIPPAANCGWASSCNTSHHKGAIRLLNEHYSNSVNVMRVAHYRICTVSAVGLEHEDSGGAVWPYDKYNSIVSSVNDKGFIGQDLLSKRMQHELSHNLGVDGHCDNINNEVCIMKNDINLFTMGEWCSSCRDKIFIFK